MKRIVVIGLGSIAKRHLANIKTLLPEVKTLAISSSGLLPDTIANVDQLSADIQDAIAFKPDFAIVASPSSFHLQHTKILLVANIPVLIEKPITDNSKDANELITLINKANVPVGIAYCLRYLPAANVVKKILEEKKLGSLYNIVAHVGQFLPQWRNDKDYRVSVSASKRLGGGVLLELSHELDYLDWLLGPLEFRYATLRNTKELNLEVEEIADILLTTKSGSLCTVHLDFIQKYAQRFCYFIGEHGHMYWDLLKNRVSINSGNEEIVFDEPSWDKNNMYISMLEDFIARIKKQDKNNEMIYSAQRTISLIDIIKSNAVWGEKQ